MAAVADPARDGGVAQAAAPLVVGQARVWARVPALVAAPED